jgi:hypothetical protein
VSQKPNRLIGDWIKNDTELAIANTMSEKKIKEFNREDMAELVSVMGQWRLLLGVTGDSTETELIFICQFIYDNFGKFTLSDVRIAMNWTISGKVDVGYVTQKNISAYYISKALQAYENKKIEIINEIAINKERLESRYEDKRELTPEEKAKSFKEYLIMIYESYKENGKFWDGPEYIYKWLKETGQVNPTKDEINEAVIFGYQKLMKEKEEDAFEKTFKNINKEKLSLEDSEARKKKYAREFIVCKIFDSVELYDLLKKINIQYFKSN